MTSNGRAGKNLVFENLVLIAVKMLYYLYNGKKRK